MRDLIGFSELCDELYNRYKELVGEEEYEEPEEPESLIYPIYVVCRYIAPLLHNNRHWNIRDPPGVIHILVTY